MHAIYSFLKSLKIICEGEQCCCFLSRLFRFYNTKQLKWKDSNKMFIPFLPLAHVFTWGKNGMDIPYLPMIHSVFTPNAGRNNGMTYFEISGCSTQTCKYCNLVSGRSSPTFTRSTKVGHQTQTIMELIQSFFILFHFYPI